MLTEPDVVAAFFQRNNTAPQHLTVLAVRPCPGLDDTLLVEVATAAGTVAALAFGDHADHLKTMPLPGTVNGLLYTSLIAVQGVELPATRLRLCP